LGRWRGLPLPATLAERLGIEQAADQLVNLGDRPGAARPGRKLLTWSMPWSPAGTCIDDVELLRCRSTQAVLGHRGDGDLHRGDVATRVHAVSVAADDEVR
jgi:hypothetical protein